MSGVLAGGALVDHCVCGLGVDRGCEDLTGEERAGGPRYVSVLELLGDAGLLVASLGE